MTDPIADMLTRIRNAQMVKKNEVILPYSKLKINILEILAKEGWLEAVEKNEDLAGKPVRKNAALGRFATIKIKLNYSKNDQRPKISKLERISKPGRRVYVDKDNIPYILNGNGMAVISTSKGLLTDKEARRQKIGGEVLCAIY
ncbi:30S ribosomal protein S8 [Candidatus Kuenenbacteria bacterium RIFCSPHIGHO2_12_FULL_42_14]|uniref:Small ribosomal subunit protein uS8 n=2 Tax=Candidatus Kueneniibacteriota TaxID=1752740 RepID=A0A1F6GTE4_9BACT|nr:MAG: 30S ribosomal protein S8 [Candidatus Kuenenbacteria bacterium RIFCSPHIGHO2_02_FULL_42_29]OGG89782.1 MAG: 30S ribosomal protein S8 [Candidatus Kuenenbacteria bacterium RIFCSPLOWO2_02_FULL_42_16]OGH01261.1 MAG: 30S ribosomal protein S8 [Candidatus Kuenenbacteria bacterium RIFCSPHIGHO2_12_FULL_42_14]